MAKMETVITVTLTGIGGAPWSRRLLGIIARILGIAIIIDMYDEKGKHIGSSAESVPF
jgi:hypothetical protein